VVTRGLLLDRTQRARRPPQSESVNALDWDHNAYYQRLLLRQLPRPCNRVLDVGCGAGAFAVELAKRAERVDALDRSPAMIEEARRVAPPNVTCILADLLQEPLPDAGYDAIVSISALHHTPLPEVLPRLAGALRPGGVLAAAALPRRDLPRELPAELTAVIGHRLFGAAFAILRTFGRGRWYAMEPNHAIMPVILDPSLTTRRVRQQASALLPGAHVRRLVFWRYFLLWQKPVET
jgi:SAM-dependent methyltransferase